MFSIRLNLSNWGDGIEEFDYESKYQAKIGGSEFKPTTLYYFYKWTAEEDLYIEKPNAFNYGLFNNRISAYRFLKFFKSSIDDNFKEKIMDVLSIIGADSEDLERILNIFNRVRVHGLYDDKVSLDPMISDKKMFDKSII